MNRLRVYDDLHAAPGATRIDPVCGMSVADTSPHRLQHRGATYGFCCAGCLERFRREPERYTAPRLAVAAETPVAASRWRCPMHAEVRSAVAGPCPKRGMALEPQTPVAPRARTKWTFPMHPEVVRDQPGICPICGMALEPGTVSTEEPENPELADMRRRWFGARGAWSPGTFGGRVWSSAGIIRPFARRRAERSYP